MLLYYLQCPIFLPLRVRLWKKHNYAAFWVDVVGARAHFLEYWLNFFNCSSLFVTRAPVEKTQLRGVLCG